MVNEEIRSQEMAVTRIPSAGRPVGFFTETASVGVGVEQADIRESVSVKRHAKPDPGGDFPAARPRQLKQAIDFFEGIMFRERIVLEKSGKARIGARICERRDAGHPIFALQRREEALQPADRDFDVGVQDYGMTSAGFQPAVHSCDKPKVFRIRPDLHRVVVRGEVCEEFPDPWIGTRVVDDDEAMRNPGARLQAAQKRFEKGRGVVDGNDASNRGRRFRERNGARGEAEDPCGWCRRRGSGLLAEMFSQCGGDAAPVAPQNSLSRAREHSKAA